MKKSMLCVACGEEIRPSKAVKVWIKEQYMHEFSDPESERHLCPEHAVREKRKKRNSSYYFDPASAAKTRRYEIKLGDAIDAADRTIAIMLTKQTITRLARWYYELGKWDWPSDMPAGEKHKIVNPMRYMIKSVIGPKECARYYEIDIRGKTKLEFELQWQKDQENNKIA